MISVLDSKKYESLGLGLDKKSLGLSLETSLVYITAKCH